MLHFIGINDAFRQTLWNLFSVPNGNNAMAGNPKSMNLFDQRAGFDSLHDKEELPLKAGFSVNKAASAESRAAQMTIFYAGQVIVFNDFPGDKANEIIELASRGSSQKFSTSVSNSAKSTADSSNLIPPH
ncbi:hypothetical protein Nepgr_005417 [Nepenthes gracilis]|uniref:Protein TIFY n=1 Tax=Nepenthes gracilis TaxID=150966 RepID=A0AAD3S377_NEPGR|nr:hypothetical protein Nepgr_005417 [Nepenthes gracilis]